ncbi:uncharacterized protein LOC100905603 [Galendromus occidentalis]|uniref:Uncharacterized protein LOC100905603 n=1 Tax=Galendromus occidentalis TaxID=34638 RepID=A0AAJ7PAE1_9ACAR|nr:uncharacterized protein LOC100905603 [Galendromus occidentalis]
MEFWRCQFKKSCKVRLHRLIANGEVAKVSGSHSDPSDAAGVEIAGRRTAMKRRAEETQETPGQVINSVQSGAPLAVQMEFPSNRVLAKVVNRVRKACASAPALPTHRSLIIIPEDYAVYEPTPGTSERFLIGDSGLGDDERILIFGRESVASWIGLVDKIYVDGTFSLAPKLFQQVFAVLAERSGFVVPVCYALLPNKSQATYTRMVELLHQEWPQFNPMQISVDFELALVNGFRSVFPNAEINGCLFHLVKNMKAKLGDIGLIQRYNRDPDFSLSARMIPALAFVPPAHINTAMSELAPELPEELMPVLNYFEDNYIGRLRLAPGAEIVRAPARFPIAMWSVYQRTVDGEARTNNFAEAAHRRLQGEFGVDHPSLWKFIDGIRKVQQSRDVTYARYVAGHNPEPKRKLRIRSRKPTGKYFRRFRLVVIQIVVPLEPSDWDENW